MSDPIDSMNVERARAEAKHQRSDRVAMEVRLQLLHKRLIAAETELEQRKRGVCPRCWGLEHDVAVVRSELEREVRRTGEYRDATRKAQAESTAAHARASFTFGRDRRKARGHQPGRAG